MSSAFWDEHWRACDSLQFYAPYLQGYIGRGRLAQIMRLRLPRTGTILEAGCGKAQFVVSLRARGYDCLGLDNAVETVEGVRRLFPELPLVCGDVCHLPYEDRSFAAYLSLGVVEHFVEGPDLALSEAHRVLKDDGVLIISVPQVFPWRLREIEPQPLTEDFSFYQYAFPPGEFEALLNQNGFAVKERYGYGSEFGLKLRWPALGRLFKLYPRVAVALRLALDLTPLHARLARMQLYVALKKGD